MYCNISNSSTTTSQKHMLQRPKNAIATFENHLLQHHKNSLQHGRKQQKRTNNKRDGFEVQAALAPGPITFEFAGGMREYDPKLARTLATAVSLSRGRGGLRSRGGGGLRSREGPTYLIGAAAVVLVSGGRGESRVAGAWGSNGGRRRRDEEREGWSTARCHAARDGNELAVCHLSRWAGGAAQ
jgi:hypothetical protein